MLSKTPMHGGGFFASEGLGGPIGLAGRGHPWRRTLGTTLPPFSRQRDSTGRMAAEHLVPGPGRGDECPPGEPRTD